MENQKINRKIPELMNFLTNIWMPYMTIISNWVRFSSMMVKWMSK